MQNLLMQQPTIPRLSTIWKGANAILVKWSGMMTMLQHYINPIIGDDAPENLLPGSRAGALEATSKLRLFQQAMKRVKD